MLGDIELDGGPTSALGQKRTWAGGVAGGDFIPRGGSAYEAIADVTVWRRARKAACLQWGQSPCSRDWERLSIGLPTPLRC
jgi:hypothetical protein